MTIEKVSQKLTLYSIWSLVLFSFISLSASSLSHIFILIPGFYFIFREYKSGTLQFSKSSCALLAVVGIAILSVLLAPDIVNKLKQIAKVKYMLLGFLAIFAYRHLFKTLNRGNVKTMLTVFLVLITIGNIAGIHALFDGFHYLRWKPAADMHRSAGMYGMAITYGYGIEMILILLIGLILNFWSDVKYLVNRYLLVICTFTCAVGLYFSLTRGAILALFVSLPFVFITTRRKIFLVGSLMFAIIFVGLVSYLSTTTVFKMGQGNRLFMNLKTESNMIRVTQYWAAWKAFEEKPLTGFGFRNFENHVPEIKKKYNIPHLAFAGHAHNNYLEMLAGTGFFGFLSFLLFVIFWIWEISKRKDELGIVLLPLVISFAIAGLFQNTFTDGENMFVIMFFYGISQAVPLGVSFSAPKSNKEKLDA